MNCWVSYHNFLHELNVILGLSTPITSKPIHLNEISFQANLKAMRLVSFEYGVLL